MSATAAYQCPECPREFDSQKGLNTHRGHTHETGTTLECSVCDDEFTVRQYRSDAVTCSEECQAKWQSKEKSEKVSIECEECGREFGVKKWRQDSARFCSRNCQKSFIPDANRIQAMYTDQRLTTYQIGQSLNINPETVRNRLRRLGIERRPDSGWGKTVQTENGLEVRSHYEKVVAKFLSQTNWDWEYEPNGFGPWTPDFVVEGFVVEVWGMMENKEYRNRRQKKQDWYSRNDYQLISIEPCDMENLSKQFEEVNSNG